MLHRAGRRIDALDPAAVKVIEQEEDLDRRLYDGRLTAVLFLRGVRAGDAVEVSYTIRGANPVFGGRFADELPLGFGVPVGRLGVRLLVPLRSERSFLGLMWSYINPLSQFFLYWFVMGYILNLHKNVPNFAVHVFSALIVVVPLIAPVAVGFGVDPVHLGIVFLTNLEIGYLTPPVGLNLFISSFRFKEPVIKLYSASVPFLLLMLLALVIITYAPALSLALVHLVR